MTDGQKQMLWGVHDAVVEQINGDLYRAWWDRVGSEYVFSKFASVLEELEAEAS